MDGDVLGDTPPDPGPVLYKAHAQDICANRPITVTGTVGGSPASFTLEPDPANVMSYYASCVPAGTPPAPQKFTFGQIQQMHKALKHQLRSQLWP